MKRLSIKRLHLSGFLSFAPASEPVELRNLNVLIGPNGSGKSNLIEAIELLHATPTGLANAIRDGGGAEEWVWKGKGGTKEAAIDAVLAPAPMTSRELRYRLAFHPVAHRLEIVDERLEETTPRSANGKDVAFYYRLEGGRFVISKRKPKTPTKRASLRENLRRSKQQPGFRLDESILSQRKEPDIYPELAWLGQQFSNIQTFREWSFGRYAAIRKPQPATLPSGVLTPDALNLGMVLNELEHRGHTPEFNHALKRFFPRFERVSTLVIGGTVQFYLHESGLGSPIPATRISDGTIRFLALLATLLNPSPPPIVCIEEPELGLHPDALLHFGELLVAASERMQLIVTTHSEALVSALTEEVDSVLVCEYLGGTVLRRVESAKLQHWLEKYRLGEIWRIGELGGNP